MNKVTKDVAILSTIPEKVLDKLNDKILYVICQQVQEDVNNGKEITELDFGLFILYIKHSPNEDIKYKVVPSDLLSKSVGNTVINKLNCLEDVLNETLAKKFLNVYKDIC